MQFVGETETVLGRADRLREKLREVIERSGWRLVVMETTSSVKKASLMKEQVMLLLRKMERKEEEVKYSFLLIKKEK